MKNFKRAILKRTILNLCKVPQTIYYNDPMAHTQIEAITRAVWELQNTNWDERNIIEYKRRKEQWERMNQIRQEDSEVEEK